MKELRIIFFTFLISTISLQSFGQNSTIDSLEDHLLIQIKKVLESKSVEELLKLKKAKCITSNALSHDEKNNLIETYYHNLVRIQIEYRINESTTSFYGYDISLINIKDEIIYFNILDMSNPKKNKYKNQQKLTELQNAYSNFYFDTLKLDDLETNKEHTYGTSCGISGEELNERTEMEKHLTKKDVSFFNSWISNPSLELKLYAYEAFRRLEKKGLKLSSKHIEILRYLENNNSYVRTCEGCIVESIEMKELIKTIEIR